MMRALSVICQALLGVRPENNNNNNNNNNNDVDEEDDDDDFNSISSIASSSSRSSSSSSSSEENKDVNHPMYGWLVSAGTSVVAPPQEKFLQCFLESKTYLPIERIKRQLLDDKINVNTRDEKTGRTPLSFVCSHQQSTNAAELVKFLLQEHGGAVESINTPDNEGLTPLHYAALAGNAGIIDLCLRFGADPNLKDHRHGQTPLHVACGRHFHQQQRRQKSVYQYQVTATNRYSKNQQIDCMDLLINANPALLEEKDNRGRTPIFECIQGVGVGVSWDLVSFMLERGAQLTVIDHQQQNLVHHVLKEVSHHLNKGGNGAVPPRVLFESQILFRLMINLEPQLLSQRDGGGGGDGGDGGDDGSGGSGLTPFQTVCFWGNADLIFYFLKEHCAIQELL